MTCTGVVPRNLITVPASDFRRSPVDGKTAGSLHRRGALLEAVEHSEGEDSLAPSPGFNKGAEKSVSDSVLTPK